VSSVLRLVAGSGLMLLLALAPARAAQEALLASPWVLADNARVRVVAAHANGHAGKPRLMAGVEIELADGWKTYWRQPGTSGVAPRIDWSGSGNLAQARLLFPAPTRFIDRDDVTIGYKKAVVLPIEMTPKDRALPVDLKLAVDLGICKDLCIPVELALTLRIPPDVGTMPADSRFAAFLDRVPVASSARGPTDPSIVATRSDLGGDHPRLVIDAAFPNGIAGADLLLEGPDGVWVPIPKLIGPIADNVLRFEINLSEGSDIAGLIRKPLLATLVSNNGRAEATVTIE